MQRLTLFLVAVVICGGAVCGMLIDSLYDAKLRLEANQRALLSDVDFYRTEAGESAASVAALSLELDELRDARGRDAQKIRDLGIRLRRAESISRAATVSSVEERVVVRDSVILRDTLRDTLMVFLGGDVWNSISGVIRGDTLHYRVQSVDTLFQVVHRVPRRFLFFRYGTKGIRQEIISSNPHTRLVYSEYIELNR